MFGRVISKVLRSTAKTNNNCNLGAVGFVRNLITQRDRSKLQETILEVRSVLRTISDGRRDSDTVYILSLLFTISL